MKRAQRCGWCGAKPAAGDASINDVAYCHEVESPTCYELATRAETRRIAEFVDLDPGKWEALRGVLGDHVDNPIVQRWVVEFQDFMRDRETYGPTRVEQIGFWDQLGQDEGGMPLHLPMPLTAEGHGPADPDEADHLGCWCGKPDCILARAFMEAFELGRASRD